MRYEVQTHGTTNTEDEAVRNFSNQRAADEKNTVTRARGKLLSTQRKCRRAKRRLRQYARSGVSATTVKKCARV